MKRRSVGGTLLLALLSALVLFPVIYTVCSAFMSNREILYYYGSLVTEEAGEGRWLPFHLIPDAFSLDAFYQILLRRPHYLIKFWNSLFLTGVIVPDSWRCCLAGYGFRTAVSGQPGAFRADCHPDADALPGDAGIQLYCAERRGGVIGSYLSVILPGIFAPFGVFWMRQVMDGIPDELLEAAALDGAGQMRILCQVVVPAAKGGLVSLIILSFVDNWNMVEQPLVFLKDRTKYPLSIFLSQINAQTLGAAFASGLLAMLPVALLFAFFQEELAEGISLTGRR